jgi:D-beta-D-heptose 7-phosphate kinase/D-beta-D-heptose 1-phosphate adenosyltransferase
VDAIVLSDYNKGVLAPGLCQAVIGLARQQGIPVFVDPKGRNMLKYRGATAITPNRGEFQELCASLGIPTSDFIAAAREAIRRLELHYLVVTRSEDGMILIGPDAVLEVPASAREVFDVTGAGDTAIAVLAIGVASGLPVRDVLTLANGACGVVVGKVGTSAIELAELERLVAGEPSFMSEKICSLEEARARVKAWQEAGESVVFTNGCFDILHAGHVSYLEKARREGARLVLGLNSDASVRRLKGPSRPVNAEGDRALVLAALQSIDAVVLFGEDTPLELILALRPDVLAKGADYELDQIVGAPEVQSWGGRVARVELLAGRSTTAVLKKLQQ